MVLYVTVAIDCVEEDVDFEALAQATVDDVQLAQPFHTVTLGDWEAP